jgi:hypothetical protein
MTVAFASLFSLDWDRAHSKASPGSSVLQTNPQAVHFEKYKLAETR